MEFIKKLGRLSLLKNLEPDILEKIAEFSHEVEVAEETVLIKQGESENLDLYGLVKGEIRIGVKTEKKEVILTVLKESDLFNVFGEMTLLSNNPRTATIITNTPSVLIKVDYRKFNKLIEENANTGRTVYRNLAEMLVFRLTCTDILLEHTIDWGW